MPEDLNRHEPERLIASTRAAAMWLALLAVALVGVLLLALWSTGLAADRPLLRRLLVGGFAVIASSLLAWAVITAFGVFTADEASKPDVGQGSPQGGGRRPQRTLLALSLAAARLRLQAS